MKQRVMGEVKKLFRPEFLNRIDEIIVFKSLTEEEIVKIVDLMIADLRERLIEQNMSINLTPEASRFVAKEGTDLSFGARPLRAVGAVARLSMSMWKMTSSYSMRVLALSRHRASVIP